MKGDNIKTGINTEHIKRRGEIRGSVVLVIGLNRVTDRAFSVSYL